MTPTTGEKCVQEAKAFLQRFGSVYKALWIEIRI